MAGSGEQSNETRSSVRGERTIYSPCQQLHRKGYAACRLYDGDKMFYEMQTDRFGIHFVFVALRLCLWSDRIRISPLLL